jgi:hypothetical protein
VLGGQNAPINEIYDVVYPDHMIFTYRFVIGTEGVEQMNSLVEKINFETDDYWGIPKGFRFRTKVDSYSHTVELQADVDRLVKTEFNLLVYGYLLPENYNVEYARRPTTRKILTPKKVIMGTEVVTSDFDFESKNGYPDRWKSQKYANLNKDDEPEAPPMVWSDTVVDASGKESVVSTFNSLYRASVASSNRTNNFVAVPPTSTSAGTEGEMASDGTYFYVYAGARWRRVAISNFS